MSCLPDLLADCPAPVVEADPRFHPLFHGWFRPFEVPSIPLHHRRSGTRSCSIAPPVIAPPVIALPVIAGTTAGGNAPAHR